MADPYTARRPDEDLPEYEALVERVEKLEQSKRIALGDLPLSAMQSALESDWQPNPSILFGEGGIPQDRISGLVAKLAALTSSMDLFDHAWLTTGSIGSVASLATVPATGGSEILDPGSHGTGNAYAAWGATKPYLIMGYTEGVCAAGRNFAMRSRVGGGSQQNLSYPAGGAGAFALAIAAGAGFDIRTLTSGQIVDFDLTNGDTVARPMTWRAFVLPLGVT